MSMPSMFIRKSAASVCPSFEHFLWLSLATFASLSPLLREKEAKKFGGGAKKRYLCTRFLPQPLFLRQKTGRWCNGNTTGFGSVIPGSNPSRPTFSKTLLIMQAVSANVGTACFQLVNTRRKSRQGTRAGVRWAVSGLRVWDGCSVGTSEDGRPRHIRGSSPALAPAVARPDA